MSLPLVKAPVYQQLNERLRELVRSGELKRGDQFPTEREIAQRFEVSRATANKAVSNLVSEGVLSFRKGLGTFVSNAVLAMDLRLLVSFTAKVQASGKRASTRVLRFERMKAGDAEPAAAEGLAVASDELVFVLERLRLADGIPYILERRHVVARFCPGLTAGAAAGSLYALWTERFKLAIAGADQIIRAVSIRGSEAAMLQVTGGTAGLLVLATGYLAGGIPLWWERTLYRGDRYEFSSRLGPVQPRPAAGHLRDADDGSRR